MKEELLENTGSVSEEMIDSPTEETDDIVPDEPSAEEEISSEEGAEEQSEEQPEDEVLMSFDLISDIIQNLRRSADERSQSPPENEDNADEVPEDVSAEQDDEISDNTDETEISAEDEAEKTKPKPLISKDKLSGIKGRIKDSGIFDSEMLKDMFFGPQGPEEEQELSETPEESEPILFDKSRKKRITADPKQDKVIFSAEYMLTPDQAMDGYMLFYSEFVKTRNIKWTVAFGVLALVFLIAGLVSGYVNFLFMLICLTMIAMKWLNTLNAGKEAALSADDVKNDSYKITFYNSRIMIEASQLVGDRIYHYPPVMIRFEDIDLKVIDYEELYVLIFKRNYIYTVPKSALSEKMNEIFRSHLENILGDDYHELFYDDKSKDKTTKENGSE